jgi:uncharacterized iron-regulated membrane protein
MSHVSPLFPAKPDVSGASTGIPLLNTLKKITLRKVLLKLHLYISLWLGAFLVLAGLTGSVLVYGTEIDRWLNADMMRVEIGSKTLPFADLIVRANQVSPFKSPPAHLELPKQPEDALIVRYQVPLPAAEQHAHKGKPHMNHHFYEVMVNPYSGQILGQRDRDDALMTIILHLHYQLLAGDTGKLVMGITAFLTLVLTLSGIYLWWPKLSKLKQAFTIKPNSSFIRFNFDLHKTSGIYTAIVLFAVALSGFYFNMPYLFKPAVNFFAPLTDMPRNVKSTAAVTDGVKPETILATAQARFPDAQVQRLFLPADAKDSYRVSMRQPTESRHKGATMLWLDQYNGKILIVRDPNKLNAGDAFINLQLPLHNGEILGTPGRILVIIVGFAPLLLMITGLIHWWKKRQAKKVHVARLRSA